MKVPFFLLIGALYLSACAPTTAASPTPAPTQAATRTPAPSATATKAPTPTQTLVPVSDICSPLADHELSSLPNYLTQPLIRPLGENKELGHHGVDFAYYRRDGVGGHIEGTPIQSVLDGAVAGLGYTDVYGNYLIIETPFANLPPAVQQRYELVPEQSLYLLYAHMQGLAPFSLAEATPCGSVLGQVGNSGDAFFVTEPHLHLETRAGPAGVQFEPMNYYTTQASEAEKAAWEYWRSSQSFTLLDPMLLLGAAP